MFRIFTQISLLTFFLFYSLSSFSQVKRNLVVYEIGTGTWCYNCQGAAWGVEDMLEKGHNIAVIEYHYDDDYENEFSAHRVGPNYYNVEAYPTTFFDGTDYHIGGHAWESIYETYLPFYYDHIDDLCPYSLTLDCSYEEGTYHVTANMEELVSVEGEVALHCVVTESNIPEPWQDSDELDFVARTMIPDSLGTDLDFSTETSQSITLDFAKNEEWVHENIEIVVFIQDKNTKEIYQAEKFSFHPLEPGIFVNLTKIIEPEPSLCGNLIRPKVLIKNEGEETITDLKFNIRINEVNHEWLWNGEVKSNRGTEILMPDFEFIPENPSELEITILEANLTSEFGSVHTHQSMEFVTPETIEDISTLYIEVKTNAYGSNWEYEVLDSMGDTVYHSGVLVEGFTVFTAELDLEYDECYTYIIHDLYDVGGLCLGDDPDWNGYFKLMDANGEVFHEQCELDQEARVLFRMDDPTIGIKKNENSFSVYPNPTSGKIYLKSSNTSPVEQIKIYNLSGQLIQQEAYKSLIDISEFPKGVYFIRIEQGNKSQMEKIILK